MKLFLLLFIITITNSFGKELSFNKKDILTIINNNCQIMDKKIVSENTYEYYVCKNYIFYIFTTMSTQKADKYKLHITDDRTILLRKVKNQDQNEIANVIIDLYKKRKK